MKILIAGDFCPKDRVDQLIKDEVFDEIIGDVRNLTTQMDYSILNFETCVNDVDAKPIIKQGPNLCCSPKAIDLLHRIGFNVVTLANNHYYDYGEAGVCRTNSFLDKAGIKHVGGGRDIEEASGVLYIEKSGVKVAIVNCCEHEFSIATDKSGGSSPLDPIKQYYSIIDAKKIADYVIVIVHGGHELHQLPSPRMVDTYRFFIDVGADLVINHHQHCYSGYEKYHNKTIYYGLGNFCFDWAGKRNSNWNYGYMVQIVIDSYGLKSSIIPYEQCNHTPGVKVLPENAFDENLNEINSLIVDRAKLQIAIEEFYEKSKNEVEHFLNPYQSRILRGLSRKRMFYSFFKKKWILRLQNVIMCESYREKLDYYFKHYRYEK